MDDYNLPDFKGKIVVFYTKNPSRAIQDGISLEYISFDRYENKLFLSGRVPQVDEKGSDWVSNLKAGLAWEDVSHFIIFDSREEYLSRLGNIQVPFLQKFIGN
jgi:hypothetical protein